MEVEIHLKDATARRQEIVNNIQVLDAKRQELLQEALRLDGEVRILTKLMEKGNVLDKTL